MKFVAKTDIGKFRHRNEDLCYFDEKLQIFAIADGVGGQAHGDLASQIAIQVIQEWTENTDYSTRNLGYIKKLEILNELATEANLRVYQASQQHEQSMGTTLIAGFVTSNYLAYVSVGDSRLYILHDDVMTQITTDDTLVQEMVDKGEITPQQSRVHEKRNIIMQAIGWAETVNITADLHPLIPGDIILACTDGLHDLIVDDNEIVQIIQDASTLEDACDTLIETALNYGGPDNVTVLLTNVD